MGKKGGEWHKNCFQISTQNPKGQFYQEDRVYVFNLQTLILHHITTPITSLRALKGSHELTWVEKTDSIEAFWKK